MEGVLQKIFWGDGIHCRRIREFVTIGQYKVLPVADRPYQQINFEYEYGMRGSRRRNNLDDQDGAKLKIGIAKVKTFLADFSVDFVRID